MCDPFGNGNIAEDKAGVRLLCPEVAAARGVADSVSLEGSAGPGSWKSLSLQVATLGRSRSPCYTQHQVDFPRRPGRQPAWEPGPAGSRPPGPAEAAFNSDPVWPQGAMTA